MGQNAGASVLGCKQNTGRRTNVPSLFSRRGGGMKQKERQRGARTDKRSCRLLWTADQHLSGSCRELRENLSLVGSA